MICLRCGNENDATFQHRVHCGAPLAAPAPERRKLATLVFCDLSGSTAMGEHADAETVRGLMLAYFEEMRVALERHGGTVEKFVGDAVLAVFGVPEAHEDDALRACRAALEMKERAEILNEDLQRRFGTRIALKLGVNTGEVIAGDPSSRQTFVTGDAVNVAARLEQAAQGGEVLIGDPTYRLVRGAVRVEAVEPLSAKGKSEPVPAYRLLEVTAVGPAARRLGTPFTGREAELALLERELEAVVSEGECRPVTIVGEPGVGKSRLVAEFVERVDGRARVVRGTCLSYGEGITYWAIGQIVRELARVTDGHSPGEARALIESLVAGLPNGTAVATNVAQLLGLADGAATADETAAAIRDVLAAGAREEPLVVVDDIQWAEPMLLDLLASLPDRLAEAPIMLLCLARPELPEHRPDWQATVHLEPFVGHDVDSLLEALLGTAPADVRARLGTEGSDGATSPPSRTDSPRSAGRGAHRDAVAGEVALTLRSDDAYAELAARAARKRAVLDSLAASEQPRIDDAELVEWYFGTLGQEVPAALDTWAAAFGWRRLRDFFGALRAEWRFRAVKAGAD